MFPFVVNEISDDPIYVLAQEFLIIENTVHNVRNTA